MTSRSAPRAVSSFLLAAALFACASPLFAGQVRITVSSFAFTPSPATLNLGDHAVWVWSGGSHNVVSGSTTTFTPDGLFNSGLPAGGLAFSWKSTVTGSRPYFCQLHTSLMPGLLNIAASGVPVSDFRITEVLFNDPGNADRVEIANLGLAAGDLAAYRLKINGVAMQSLLPAAGTSIPVPSGQTVVLHFGVTDVNTATDLYFPAIPNLPAAGSLALYVPSSSGAVDASQIIDYLEWGASGGQENEATAVSANLWAAGASVANVAPGHSIEFCGQGGQYGVAQWAEIPTPTFGTLGRCTVPTLRTTWGRVKSLYR